MNTSKDFYQLGRVGLSGLLAISTIVVMGGLINYFAVNDAQAASLTKISDTIDSSAPATLTNHTIYFVTPTGIPSSAGDKTITVEFDTTATAFGIASLASSTDVDVATSSDATCAGPWQDITVGTATTASQWTATFNTTTDIMTLTAPGSGNGSTTVPANTCLQIQVGSNATATASGTDIMTNPTKVAAVGTADVYTIAMAGTFGDSGNSMVAIIEGVTVSATIAESLSFSMRGVSSTDCAGDTGAPTVRETTTTTIPFGTVTGDAFFLGCHRLSVSTNASSGFSTTIEENTNLRSGGGVNIPDTTCDGAACSDTASATWATATNNGFGFACENVVNGGLCSFANVSTTVQYYKQVPCQGTDTQCDPGTGNDTKQTFLATSTSLSSKDAIVHYKLSPAGNQPAGTYTNTVTYVTTPTF